MRFGRWGVSFVLSIIAVLACASLGVAQYQQKALERAREIRMLQDDRAAVRAAFYDFVLDDSDETSDDFSFEEINIEVTYSTGRCEEDEEEIWDAPVGRAVRIEITSDSDIKTEDFAREFSGLMKEQKYAQLEDRSIYHDKKRGIAFEVDENTVETIILFPSVSGESKACKYKSAREFVSEKSWFGKTKLEDRKGIVCVMQAANVTTLDLSHEEVRGTTSKHLKVQTTAVDPEDDPLVYVYIVSAGRIVGTGARVVWDITGVPAGTYKITAGVDDGCGLCGTTMTKTVVVD